MSTLIVCLISTVVYAQPPVVIYNNLVCPATATVSLDRNGEFHLSDLDPGLFTQEKTTRFLDAGFTTVLNLEANRSFVYFEAAGARGGGTEGDGASLMGYQRVSGNQTLTAMIGNVGARISPSSGFSGGGGTFVTVGNGAANFTREQTLLVAGGGGGSGVSGNNTPCINSAGEPSTQLVTQSQLGPGGNTGVGTGTNFGALLPGYGGGGLLINGSNNDPGGGRAAINGGFGFNGNASFGGGAQPVSAGGGGGGATGGNGGNGGPAFSTVEDCFGRAGTSFWKGSEPLTQSTNNFTGTLLFREEIGPTVSFSVERLDCSDMGTSRTISATSSVDNSSCLFTVEVIDNYDLSCPNNITVDLSEFGQGVLPTSHSEGYALAYSRTFTPAQGYQMLHLPAEAENIVITAAGGAGGSGGGFPGGTSAVFSRTLSISEPTNLHILAGGSGSAGTFAGGGGGASWVAVGNGGLEAFNADRIYMVAGGGGGANFIATASGGNSTSITSDPSLGTGGNMTIGDIGEGGGGAGLLGSGRSPVNQRKGGMVPVLGGSGGTSGSLAGHPGGSGGGGAGGSYGGGGAGFKGGDAGGPGLVASGGTSYFRGGGLTNVGNHSGVGFVTVSYSIPINPVVSKPAFDCSDLGSSMVDVTTTNYGKYSCSFQLAVTNNTPLSCPNNMEVVLDENNRFILEDLGDNKYMPLTRDTIRASDFNVSAFDPVYRIPYTIPAGVRNFRIEAAGARGGSAGVSNAANNGGAGAKFTSDFEIDGNGLTLQLIVGRQGKKGGNADPDADNSDGIVILSGGGGGATWIGTGSTSNVMQNFNRSNILMVAGGGGGGAGDEGDLLTGEASTVVELESEFTGLVQSSAFIDFNAGNDYGGGGGGSLLRGGAFGYRSGGSSAVQGAFGGGGGFFMGANDEGTGGYGGGGSFGLDAGGGGGGGATGGNGGRGSNQAAGVNALAAGAGTSYTAGMITSSVSPNLGDGFIVISFGNVIIDKTTFDCNDISGLQTVTLSTFEECTGTCAFQLNVLTDLDIECKSDTLIVLDENDQATLDPKELITMTREGCVEVDISAIMLNFDENDISDDPVVFPDIVRISDASGASATCDSRIQVARANTVPVNLISFKGEKLPVSNRLKWETEQEINVSHFEIERRASEASEWIKIHEALAVGTGAKTNVYELLDRQPLEISYYRLKVVDYDGYYEYSKEIVLTRSADHISVFPTLASDHLIVESADDFRVSIFSITGEQVISPTYFKNGRNRIDVRHLIDGSYFVAISNGGDVQQLEKIIIQR